MIRHGEVFWAAVRAGYSYEQAELKQARADSYPDPDSDGLSEDEERERADRGR